MRSHALCPIVGYSFLSGVDWQTCVAEAVRRTGNTKTDAPEVCTMATQLIMQIRQNRSAEDSIADFRAAEFNADGLSFIEPLVVAKHAILQSMVIQAWTAFEVLAEDIWKRVNTKRPKLRAGITNRCWRKECGFRSTLKLSNTYRHTFRHDNVDILAAIDNTTVKALALARNVLVHSGGQIDEMFIKQRVGIPELRCIRGKKKGYSITFTGPLVRRLIDPTVVKGFDLVRAVDQWLISHP